MKKLLRTSLAAILALMANAAFADAYKTLTFPDDNKENNKVGAYTKEWKAIIGDDSWTISNFNNNNWGWSFIRCGRRDYESVGTIATDFAIDKQIKNVVVTIDKITASAVNSIQLIVSRDAGFSDIVETVNAQEIVMGDMVFNVTKTEANLYYKLVFDCNASSGSNGPVQLSKVEYYEGAPEIVDITNTPETPYTVAKAHELITAGDGLATKVYVKGIITEITEVSTDFGNATYYINDTEGTDGQLNIYRGYGLDGEKFTAEDDLKIGDEVIVYGQLTVYNNTHQITTGSQLYSINGITTDIDKIETETENSNAPVYNLSGQRVSKSYKGIVIQNGKKFINK